jgi:hypothetical protein
MGVVAPAALALAALALPIVALYLLKIRRRERVVSSTLLWDRVARDLEANQPWQRFRPNWLLFLQLLALAALVAALARPFWSVEAALGASTVVVLDASASMGATDVESSRIEAGKDEIRDLIDRMPEGGRMMLAVAGAQARVLQPMTDDRGALRDALAGVEAEHGQAALDDALALAGAAASRLPEAEIVVVSDGDVPDATLAELPVPARAIAVGSEGPENLAIVTMAVGRGAAGAELFVRVGNAGPAERSGRVTLFDDETGTVAAAQDIVVPAGSEVALAFGDLPPDTNVLRAELTYEGRDDLQTDDVAWARARGGERSRVLLVTPGNLFLERALALLPDLEVVLAQPGGTVPSGYDLYVFDGAAPPAGLQAPLVVVAPPADNGLVEVIGTLDRPAISGVRSDDPLLQGVDLSETHIATAASLTVPTWATALVTSGESPLLLAGLRDGLRTAILAFDLHQSDLPLQTAFPVLVANLTTWLLPETAPTAPLSASPGEVLALHPRAGADRIEIVLPAGETVRIPAEPEVLFAGTARPGSYGVRDLAGETELRASGFVVNLLDLTESDLRPAAGNVPDGGSTSDAGADPVSSLVEGTARRLLWWPAILLGIAVLALEWWAFYRGRRLGLRRVRLSQPGRWRGHRLPRRVGRTA